MLNQISTSCGVAIFRINNKTENKNFTAFRLSYEAIFQVMKSIFKTSHKS